MLKLAVLSFLCMYAYAAYYEDIAAQTILEQNSDPHASWTAGYNTYLRGKDQAAIRRLMGVKKGDNPKRTEKVRIQSHIAASIPTSFTAGKDSWPQCASTINYIKDQADCGSCWAVAASEVIEDRVCIANMPSSMASSNNHVFLNEAPPPICFSAENIMSCCKACGDGCGGGYPIDAMNYWKKTGVVTGCWYGSNCGCQPYMVPPCGPQGCSGPEAATPKCSTSCRAGYANSYKADLHVATDANSYKADLHVATDAYQVAANAAAIQTEIMTNGPVECAFDVYANFMSYKSGVYNKKGGSYEGGHAVKIIGWGVTPQGENYWIINNSWNVTWGMQGQFWFARGNNLCGMEAGCVAGMAKTNDVNYKLQC